MLKEVEKIKKQINDLTNKLVKIRRECTHKNITKEYWSNTGNYDPTQDCYGTNFTCTDCGHKWFEVVQDKKLY